MNPDNFTASTDDISFGKSKNKWCLLPYDNTWFELLCTTLCYRLTYCHTESISVKVGQGRYEKNSKQHKYRARPPNYSPTF